MRLPKELQHALANGGQANRAFLAKLPGFEQGFGATAFMVVIGEGEGRIFGHPNRLTVILLHIEM